VRDGRICERRASAVVLMQLRLRKVNSPMATEVILIEWPSPPQPIPVISQTEEWDLHWSLCARTDAPRRRSRANPYVWVAAWF